MKYERMNKAQKEVYALSSTLKIRKTDMDWIQRRHKIGKSEYFQVFERKGAWQVMRYFMYRSYSKKKEIFHEPMRFWINAKGYIIAETKNRVTMGVGGCVDAWIKQSDLQIRSYIPSELLSEIIPDYSRMDSLIPELKRAGVNSKHYFCAKFISILLKSDRMETLFKNPRSTRLALWIRPEKLKNDEFWSTIKVALRHGFDFKKAEVCNTWSDMIDLEGFCGADLHNPKFVAPENLQEMHDYFLHKHNRKIEQREEIIQQEQEKKQMKEIGEDIAKDYLKDKARYLNVKISNKDFDIHVLQNVREFCEEGLKMHHCVFACKYYSKESHPDSLILSVRDKNGTRIETVEVNTKSYEVIQCYGPYDNFTKYHTQILQLMKEQMYKIRQCDKKRAEVA